jgi:hypothetical protein
MLRESCPPWPETILFVREYWPPIGLAAAQSSGGVRRIYRLGQAWLALEAVSDHNVAIDFAAGMPRFKP